MSQSEHYDVDIDVDVFCVVLGKWRENDKLRLHCSVVLEANFQTFMHN
jgi:hypothetical protein